MGLRILIEFLAPILLPALIYLAYAGIERRRAAAAADPAVLPWWVQTPWLALVAAGLALAAILLSLVVIRSGDPVGGFYVPAHIEDGRLISGHVVSPQK